MTKNIQDIVAEFEKNFRDYLHASIAYAEVQEPYQPLSSEDEIKWLKDYLTTTLHQELKEAYQAGVRDAMEAVDKAKAKIEEIEEPVANGCIYKSYVYEILDEALSVLIKE